MSASLSVVNFFGILAGSLFLVLTVAYFIQASMAWRQAREYVQWPDNQARSLTLVDVVRFQNKWLRDVWTFVALAIFFPVVLNTLGNINGLATLEARIVSLWSVLFYHGCVAAIGVIITLEFSYVYNLRRSANDWIPVLLVAIALDIGTLLVLFIVVGHPNSWRPPIAVGEAVSMIEQIAGDDSGRPVLAGPMFLTSVAMLATTFSAVVSSAMILIFARAAGAIADNNVKPAAIEAAERSRKRQVPRESSAEMEDGAPPPDPSHLSDERGTKEGRPESRPTVSAESVET